MPVKGGTHEAPAIPPGPLSVSVEVPLMRPWSRHESSLSPLSRREALKNVTKIRAAAN